MRSAHVLLLCMLGAALLSSGLCSDEPGLEVCCFRLYSGRVNKNQIRSYFMSDERCQLTAAILVTKRSLQLCVDPNMPWVKSIMRSLDKESF
ncbi:C-C motif chemokine 3-like 1 [Labrus bergylta]|uniref:C-C motif chemokine 4-like n=1 Tax=Labrus bergylta TaxID=56723 RepID=A0A3Q3GXK4_9LABR|nr:C-C motif chemokine 4-like [Labrus bergylta]